MTRKLSAILATLALAMLVAACGGDDDQPSGGTATTAAEATANLTGFDACSLLGSEDIAEALAVDENSPGEGVSTKAPPEYDCSWNGARVNVYTGTREEVAAYHATGGEEIPGLGEDARWFSDTRSISVFDGFFDVTLFAPGAATEGAQKTVATELARQAVARLPQ